jgi:protein involved in polysaccharide export with SLBB domain
MTIYGAVANTGKLACSPGMHLVDAIVAAGGFTVVARPNHVELRRGKRTYVVSARSVIQDHWPDPELSPDDVIWVSDDSF